MSLSISEAQKSVAEDDSPRPMVGALLVDSNSGEVLVRAHRGEHRGAHAEFTLIEKARELGLDTRGTTLFTTLEPCVQRGSGKVPCVERVGSAGFASVYIGTLDPNPNITGLGEMKLSYTTAQVGRYPLSFQAELRALNRSFFSAFQINHAVRPIESDAIMPPKSVVASARKSSDRNRLLQSTLDMVAASTGEVRVWAGDLSWLREAYVPLVAAAASGRGFRFLTTPPDDEGEQRYWDAVSAAGAIGEVRRAARTAHVKMTASGGSKGCAVVIDDGSASLLTEPSDRGLLAVLNEQFEREWGRSSDNGGRRDFAVIPIDSHALVRSLRGVAQYRDADISIKEVDMTNVRPMTRNLERFKLARLSALDDLLEVPGFELAARIKGSPWPITPPVVEITPDGSAVLMDGTHRAYNAVMRGRPSIAAVVVEGVSEPLPAVPADNWDDVRSHLVKLPREDRYVGYRRHHFRMIRFALAGLGTPK